jgi:hypothetical protein
MSVSRVQSELPFKTLYQVAPLTAANFTTWKYRLQLILKDRQLWKYVDGSTPEPVDAGQRAQWEEKDQQAFSQIALTVSDSVVGHVRNARTSAEAWTKLCSVFEQRGLAAQVFLRRKLVNVKLNGGGSMLDHINTVRELSEQLNAIGAPVSDGELAITLLGSLPDRYDPLIISLESRSAQDVTFDGVAARLLAEERRQEEAAQASWVDPVATAEHALMAKFGKRKMCSYCRRPGHTEENCWDKRGHPSNGSPSEKASGNAASSHFASTF